MIWSLPKLSLSVCVLFTIFVFLSSETALGQRTVKIGVLYSATGSFAVTGSTSRPLAEFWKSYFSLPYGIGGTGIMPQLLYCDVGSTAAGAVNCTNQFVSVPVDVMIAPESSLTGVVAPITDRYRIPLLAAISSISSLYVCDTNLLPPCQRYGDRRFQYLIGATPMGANMLPDYIGLMRFSGAKTAAVVMAGDPYNTEVCQAGIASALENDIQVVYQYTLPTGYTYSQALNSMLDIKALNPDVLLYCNRPQCAETAQLFVDVQWYPASAITIQCVDSNGAPALGDQLKFQWGASAWDYRLSSREFQDDPKLPYCNRFAKTPSNPVNSAMQFYQQFHQFSGKYPGYTQAGIMGQYYMIEAAIARTNSTDSNTLFQAMSSIFINTFRGPISVDVYGVVRVAPVILYQVDSADQLQIVSPSYAQTFRFIYPAPTYEQRFFTATPFSQGIEVAIVIIVCLTNAWYVWQFAVPIFRYRGHHLIKATSWRFSLLSVLGAIVFNFSILTWTIVNNDVQCHWRLPLTILGLVLQLCPVIAAVFRINTIFNSVQLHKKKRLTDTWTAMIMLLHLCPFVILTIVWMSVSPFELQRYSTDPIRPEFDYTDCTTDWIPYGPILLAFVGVVMIEAAALAWFTREVSEVYNETVQLLLTMYIWMLTLGVTILVRIVVGASNGLSRSSSFALQSFLILVASSAFLIIRFYNKVQQVKTLPSEYYKDGRTSGANANQTALGSDIDKETGVKETNHGGSSNNSQHVVTVMVKKSNNISTVTSSPDTPTRHKNAFRKSPSNLTHDLIHA